MSVLIKGIDMPESCEKCKFEIRYSCIFLGNTTEDEDNGNRDLRCPLVEVTAEHGCEPDTEFEAGWNAALKYVCEKCEEGER